MCVVPKAYKGLCLYMAGGKIDSEVMLQRDYSRL